MTALKRGWLSIDDANPTGRNGVGTPGALTGHGDRNR